MITPFILRNTPYVQQFVCEGLVFNARFSFDLSANQTRYIQGKTGSDMLVHFISRVMTHNGEDVIVKLWENPTISAEGTTIIPSYNANRESAKTAEFTIYQNPSSASGTAVITYDRMFGAGSPPAASLSVVGIERILKKNSNYALEVLNNSTALLTFVFNWQWYESGN